MLIKFLKRITNINFHFKFCTRTCNCDRTKLLSKESFKFPAKSEEVTEIRKNQNVRKKSERCSNFRNFPDFSEDLATLDLSENKSGRYIKSEVEVL